MHFCVHYDFNTRAPTHATRFSLKSRKDCPGDHTEDEPNSIAHAFLRVLRREHSRILARISTCTINSDCDSEESETVERRTLAFLHISWTHFGATSHAPKHKSRNMLKTPTYVRIALHAEANTCAT